MDCPKCGGAMWDNRETKTNPKQPDFKCKDRENCDGVIWPPRGAAARKPAAAPPRPQPNRGSVGGDDRSNRIERQHSQEMAIRYCALKSQTDVTTEDLRKLIDWFQRDVGHVPAAPLKPEPTMTQNHDIDGEQEIPDEEPF